MIVAYTYITITVIIDQSVTRAKYVQLQCGLSIFLLSLLYIMYHWLCNHARLPLAYGPLVYYYLGMLSASLY